MQTLPIMAQRGAETGTLQMAGGRAFADRVGGAGELAAHQFLHSLSQVRESAEAESIAHDGGGINIYPFGHLIDGRERHLLRVLDNIFGDAPL